MTRLTAADLVGIGNWAEYDARTRRVLGVDLPALAAASIGRPAAEVRAGLRGKRLAAISVSGGEGLIGGFAESLASVGLRLGMEARVMKLPDAAGLEEAAAWGADYVISADDESFTVRDPAGRVLADNNPATSRVFAAALDIMCGGLSRRGVLVLGLGAIGRGALPRLCELGARPLLYDTDPEKRNLALIAKGADLIENRADLKLALRATSLIFDATPAARALDRVLWPKSPIVAAPGVPLAWPRAWMDEKTGAGRLWHDPLESGTAAMLAAGAFL